MHHGDIEVLLQTLLDIETFRSLDVFRLMPPNVGAIFSPRPRRTSLESLFIHLDVEHINTINLERESFTLYPELSMTAPMSPSPNTAVTVEITATRFPLSVYL